MTKPLLSHDGCANASRFSLNIVQDKMFAEPALVRRRLGQGAFRLLVTDGHERQCAVTPDHMLPVLELRGREIKLPKGRFARPSREMLEWHGEVVFLK
jgi:hypothetical protein